MPKAVVHVVGARPNFMKAAPLIRELDRYPDEFAQTLIHTGQHYDANMSRIFFEELGLPSPHVDLEVGSGSHANQTAAIMVRFEEVVRSQPPDWVVVYGDVNSTLACTLVCAKLGIRVAHVEAGLRSRDRSMPEEINRVATDQLADLLFTPSADADENLLAEGIPASRIKFVGNIMIDTLVRLLPEAENRWPVLREALNLDNYVLVTLHRPSNVDDRVGLRSLLDILKEISASRTVVFPMHPRTRLRAQGLMGDLTGGDLRLVDPLGYLEFLSLQRHAEFVITDSGGIQEETSFLGVPCLTIRPNTERPVTITHGTNQLVKRDRTCLLDAVETARKKSSISNRPPIPLWDGKAAKRIAKVLREFDCRSQVLHEQRH